MIKDIRIRISVDRRGKIKTGQKSAKGLPQTLDHFNITPFPELQEVYGNEPTSLILYFPTDTIEDFFDCNYVQWGKSKKSGEAVRIRTCNGESCILHIDQEVNGEKKVAGEEVECFCEHLEKEAQCSYVAYLKAFVADPQTRKIISPVCYMFETGSKNSGDAIYSEILKVQNINKTVGRSPLLLGMPFELSVRMVQGTQAKHKFPIWTLTVLMPSPQALPQGQTVAVIGPAKATEAGNEAWKPASGAGAEQMLGDLAKAAADAQPATYFDLKMVEAQKIDSRKKLEKWGREVTEDKERFSAQQLTDLRAKWKALDAKYPAQELIRQKGA